MTLSKTTKCFGAGTGIDVTTMPPNSQGGMK
jgi:hypothetical protein